MSFHLLSCLHLRHTFYNSHLILYFFAMPPKKTASKPAGSGPAPAPAPSSFLGAIPKKNASAAAAAKAAGASKPQPKTKVKAEVRGGDKRQRNSSGATANTPKKQKAQGFDPRQQAEALGGRHRIPPSPTTSISTVTSEVTDTDTGTVEDQEIGDELAGIKKCIADMQVDSVPATKVCRL